MFMKETYKQKNVKRKGTSKKEAKRKKRERRKERKKEEKKKRRDSLDSGGSGLSHFEGDFLKFLGSGYLVL